MVPFVRISATGCDPLPALAARDDERRLPRHLAAAPQADEVQVALLEDLEHVDHVHREGEREQAERGEQREASQCTPPCVR